MPRKRAIGVVGAALAVVLLAASAAAAPQRTESPAALYRFLAVLRPVAPVTGATGSFFGTATVDETTATLQYWISYERLPRRAGSSHIHRVAGAGHELPPPLPPSDVSVRPQRRPPRAALVVECAADQHRPGQSHGRRARPLPGCAHAPRADPHDHRRGTRRRGLNPRRLSAIVGPNRGATRYPVIRLKARRPEPGRPRPLAARGRELYEEAHRQASRLARPRGDTGARRGRGRDDRGRGLERRTDDSPGDQGADGGRHGRRRHGDDCVRGRRGCVLDAGAHGCGAADERRNGGRRRAARDRRRLGHRPARLRRRRDAERAAESPHRARPGCHRRRAGCSPPTAPTRARRRRSSGTRGTTTYPQGTVGRCSSARTTTGTAPRATSPVRRPSSTSVAGRRRPGRRPLHAQRPQRRLQRRPGGGWSYNIQILSVVPQRLNPARGCWAWDGYGIVRTPWYTNGSFDTDWGWFRTATPRDRPRR